MVGHEVLAAIAAIAHPEEPLAETASVEDEVRAHLNIARDVPIIALDGDD